MTANWVNLNFFLGGNHFDWVKFSLQLTELNEWKDTRSINCRYQKCEARIALNSWNHTSIILVWNHKNSYVRRSFWFEMKGKRKKFAAGLFDHSLFIWCLIMNRMCRNWLTLCEYQECLITVINDAAKWRKSEKICNFMIIFITHVNFESWKKDSWTSRQGTTQPLFKSLNWTHLMNEMSFQSKYSGFIFTFSQLFAADEASIFKRFLIHQI